MSTRLFADNTAFAHDLRETLADQWAPGAVSFRGSFQAGRVDAYSDVNLLAEVHLPLDESFYADLTRLLENCYGPMAFRYDDEHKDNARAQQVRFNFYRFPVFWRVDLEIASDRPCPAKYPDPFPELSIVCSAFWNLVWAVKYAARGKTADADHYIAAACEKLHRDPLAYAPDHVRLLLDTLAEYDETDPELIAKLRDAIQ